MYLVISRWSPTPGREEEFRERGKAVRDVLRRQPGVERLEYVRADNGDVIAIHGYTDQEAYHRVVHDPQSEFNKALDEFRLEDVSKWIGSDQGPACLD